MILLVPRLPAFRFFALAALTGGFAAGQSLPTTYKVVTLDSGGGEAFGIDNGAAVGFATDRRPVATVWVPNGPTTSLSPPMGFALGGYPVGISGNQAVGFGVPAQPPATEHALVWNLTTGAATDLTPNGFGNALGTDGTHQSGWVLAGDLKNAVVWSGTATSQINLGSTFDLSSMATGVSGNTVVGFKVVNDAPGRAIVWQVSGTTFTSTDITPPGWFAAGVYGISHGQFVGLGADPVDGHGHALLWTGPSANSFTDLNPAVATRSELLATNGAQQVGDISMGPYGTVEQPPGDLEAGVWSGAAASFQLLPLPTGYDRAVAEGIDQRGDIAGYITSSAQEKILPAVWIPLLPGDADGDGVVNFADFNILSNNFGKTGVGFSGGDFNGDGVVNFADFNILAMHFGDTLSSSQVAEVVAFGRSLAASPAEEAAVDAFAFSHEIPEPLSVGTVVAALTILIRRRRV